MAEAKRLTLARALGTWSLATLCVVYPGCARSHGNGDGGPSPIEPCSPVTAGEVARILCTTPDVRECRVRVDLAWACFFHWVPTGLTRDGEAVVLDGYAILVSARPIAAARARYRVSWFGSMPIALLSAAQPVALEEALSAHTAASSEREGRGRLLCESVDSFDVWTFLAADPLEGCGAYDEVSMRVFDATVIVDRAARQIWGLGLQPVPMLGPACVCRDGCDAPAIGPDGAWVYFGVPWVGWDDAADWRGRWGGAVDFAFYCPLQPSCGGCCGRTTRCDEEHGFSPCQVSDPGWLEAACAADTLAEIPPIGTPPCAEPPAWFEYTCGESACY